MTMKSSMPLWVVLAFSSIQTRKGALLLIWSSTLFSVYCIPWVKYFDGNGWVAKLFLIDDWSWFAFMLPMVLWYMLCLRWVDKNTGWENGSKQ
ncbi:MAG: hypothetical protein HOP23_03105 [Methylococcaceae bacterium]|nr:hypothetical protein [Methylococcaceae bacterium]